jgi:hypothetical protein
VRRFARRDRSRSGGGYGARRALLVLAGSLAAAGAGAAPAGALPVDPPTGGVAAEPVTEPLIVAASYGAPAPRIAAVACRRSCGSAGAARPGAVVRLGGKRLRGVREVLFLAGPGEQDDTSVAPRATGHRWAIARVPRTAGSGPVAAALADGTRSAPSPATLIVDPVTTVPPAGAVDAEVQRRKVFYGARRGALLSYVLGGTEPATVAIELVRVADGAVVARWSQDGAVPGVPRTVKWDGTTRGRIEREGEYRFRATVVAAPGVATAGAPAGVAGATPGADGAAVAGSTAAAEAGTFTFLRHRFPLLGAHSFGTGAGAFGGGRGHQGHDVFAACDTPVVAARGGKVAFKQFHARAGHYIVIDGAGTRVDYAYMHLRDAALVDTGDRVRTGQLIGYVGATGRASECHLHFEMWTAPGWYRGGAPVDPLPALQDWDAQS